MKPNLWFFIVLGMACMALAGSAPSGWGQEKPLALERLKQGENVSGFRTDAIYLDDTDRPMGGRFVHLKTGFVFDALQIQSVPQSFIWVNTPPTSDKGDPHTQEHLLLGKGNKGRAVANSEDMSLTQSSAYTQQWRTCYFFNTVAGPDVFYSQLEGRLDALLHPDYTDEEIRREVRNFGISEDPDKKTLRLEEKGTVYNEMVGTFDQPGARLFYTLNHLLYGKNHPLAYESGGTPEALRVITPQDIRTFHHAHYRLDKMGMVGAFPKEMPLAQVLQHTDALLNRLQPNPTGPNPEGDVPKFPTPQPAPPGTIEIAEYPDHNEQQPGSLVFAWPAVRRLDTKQQSLLELFLATFAGDPATNLYKKFIDTKTRTIDVGAKGVAGFSTDDQGYPVMISLSDVTLSHLNEKEIVTLRQAIMDELTKIAAWKDGSPELAEFNTRLAAHLIETRRYYSKNLNTPPGFGARFSSAWWMNQLRELERSGGFRRSITEKPDLAYVEKLLASKKNFWRQTLADWQLTGTTPYAVAIRPSASLATRQEQQRNARIEGELARLKQAYGTDDAHATLQRYLKDYEAATAEIDARAKQVPTPSFIDSPPLTLDDQLDFKAGTLPGGIPLVASTFENMTSGATGIALRLNGVPEDQLLYLTLMPGLLTNVGIVENGKPVSYEQMQERLRKEILALGASFSVNERTGRYELVVRGSGNTTAESQRAVAWIKRVLLAPDWRPENLARIRDVVDQTLNGLRNVRQGAEENWVSGVGATYRKQENPLYLTTASFLTRTHNVLRLRWQLMEATDADRTAARQYLDTLAAAGQSAQRSDLQALLRALQSDTKQAQSLPASLMSFADTFSKLPAGVKRVATEAAKDLAQTLSDIPDDSLARDWAYLCQQMGHDLSVTPEKALANLNALRQSLLRAGSARLFVIGSTATQQKLAAPLRDLVSALQPGQTAPVSYGTTPRILARLRERQPDALNPVFVGLLNPNSQGGVFLNSAPGITYADAEPEPMLRYLASNLYAGSGAHGVFMQTWGAGLAYSNGIGNSPDSGRINYYAERCPELPQTLRFVIDLLKKSPHDLPLTDYAIAQAFYSRAAGEYEERGEAQANDLEDGVTPDRVRHFRQSLLGLRDRTDLSSALYARMDAEYARVLPGYGVKMSEVPGGNYFVIGAEKQFAAYEAYLKSVEGPETKLYRLSPRDFWLPARL